MATPTTTRLPYLDITKCFAIFCVVLGHVFQWTFPTDPYHDSMTFQFIYSFHMPLFMMLSGCFLGKLFKLSPIQFLKKRAIQLLLPVATFSCLYVGLYDLASILDKQILPISLFSYLGGSWMWFLKYLFIDTVIAYFSIRLLRKEWLAALLPPLLLFCLTRNTMFRLLPYLWTGYFIYQYRNAIERHIKTVLAFNIVLFTVFLYFWKGDYDAAYRFIFFKPTVYFDLSNFWAAFVRLGVGMTGSLTFIYLFKWIYQQLPSNVFTEKCAKTGQQTFGIYCLQIYILEEMLTHLIPCTFRFYGDVVARCSIAFIVLTICSLCVTLLDKNRFTALFFLGKYRKKADRN